MRKYRDVFLITIIHTILILTSTLFVTIITNRVTNVYVYSVLNTILLVIIYYNIYMLIYKFLVDNIKIKNRTNKTKITTYITILIFIMFTNSILLSQFESDFINLSVYSVLPKLNLILDTSSKLLVYLLSLFIQTCLIAPVAEELIYRKFILNNLLDNSNAFKSIVLSSFLFSIYHLNLLQGINAMMIGIFLGYLYYKTCSINICILLHFVNNFTNFIILTIFII
ncbi:TPA: CPBP family intramembrane metalloprotease [Clostridioides difficile]|nr:type II CAAX endopeptidase family protein [Clostridioides difficile]HDF2795437.1 CPBP family intramembrane metalloprotease [Clostridioides difficile]